MSRKPCILVGGLLLAAVALVAVKARTPTAADVVSLRVISSRPDTVTGGDTLVEMSSPGQSHWSAYLDGRDVTAAFHLDGHGRLLALLTGLREERSTVELRVDGKSMAALEIRNHPLAGPLFSGPHQEPFICQTQDNGLGPPLDADCNATSVVTYYYKSSTGQADDAEWATKGPASNLAAGFKPYDPNGPRPGDLAKIVTPDGVSLDYIVRRETGTINRAVYDIEFLQQPGEPTPNPWASNLRGWNGRLLYIFGGGCGTGYRQGLLGDVGATQAPFLAQGYAVATSSLNISANNCNDRVSSETLSMVKEHFIKQYGPPVHTIGLGSSGGAIQMHLTAQNYPGLLDGIVAFRSFPDVMSTALSVTDCHLLERAFRDANEVWTDQQKALVSGFATWHTCVQGWSDGHGHPWPLIDPKEFCDPLIPTRLIYDRSANPKGMRCDVYANEINFLGVGPQGYARRPLDNVGVQYGLLAFQAGKISAEQFIGLNERIGGYDADGLHVAARMQADLPTVLTAYSRGLILTGGGGLGRVPIIDWHLYSDDLGDQHDRFRTFVTRARLQAVNGSADNQVMLVDPRRKVDEGQRIADFDPRLASRQQGLVRLMDRWLDNIAADHSEDALTVKIARGKPPDLSEGCRTGDGKAIVEHAVYAHTGECNRLYPTYSDPRVMAGGPLTDDVLKCKLKPIRGEEYSRSLSNQQMERLKHVFPSGVCDYDQPGIGQQVSLTTWQQYPARAK